MTSTLPTPTVEVERPSREQIARHLLDDAEANNLPYPATVQMTNPERVAVFFDLDSERDAWREFFGSPWPTFHGISMGTYSTQAATEAISRTEQIRQAASFADVEPASTCRFCGGEMTHRLGCAVDPVNGPVHFLADSGDTEYACGLGGGAGSMRPFEVTCEDCRTMLATAERLALAPECVDCSMPGGHQESCAFASRVDPEAAAQIPVVVVDVPKPTVHLLHADWSRECGAEDEYGSISLANVTCTDCLASRAAAADLDLDEPIPYTPFDPDAREYVPTCFDEPTMRLPHPGVHYVPEGVHPRGYVPVAPVDHHVPIVEVTDVVRGPLVERDDNAAMARVLPEQMSFAEAADRLAADRLADAMLGEAAE